MQGAASQVVTLSNTPDSTPPERTKPPQTARAPGRTTVNNVIHLLQKDLEMLPGR